MQIKLIYNEEMWLIVCGFFVHVVLLASVFDIYFKSPVIHGIVPYSSPSPAPAKRLVLFVADGLRADSFYNRDTIESNAPYLRSVIETRGSWGVSHTRVPTESRPGHVALIAGLYEDPSAIARGWKENPVEFDSVFNRSRFTWSWGSPDILPMFAKGASGDRVAMDMYDADAEDFSGAHSTTKLDTWVFDRVEAFLLGAKSDPPLYEKLRQDKVVLFLHLLGLDTAGHTHKPHSKEYSENIQVVDGGIKKIERIIEEFYEFDEQTSFVFTADHGMTDWGSHGAGDKSETETPIVAWGAGVSGPKRPAAPHESPLSWQLDHLLRRDVKQADIAPLMSTLVGAAIPVNSVGFLPVDYLNVSELQLSEAIFSNAWQMTAQYGKKREQTEYGTLSWLYRPFVDLTKEKEVELLRQIRSDIAAGNHVKVISRSQELISLTLAGLDYYQNYYQCLLLCCVSLTFVGWIVWLLLALIPKDTTSFHSRRVVPTSRSFIRTAHNWFSFGGIALNVAFTFCVATTVYLIFVQLLPLQFYVYCLLPQLLLWSVARRHKDVTTALSAIRHSIGGKQLCIYCLLYLFGIEIMVLSFFRRFVLSVGVLSLCAWPLTSRRARSAHWTLLVAWIASCALLAVFPVLPVVGRDANIGLLSLSGWLWLVVAVCFTLRPETHLMNNTAGGRRAMYATLVQLAMLPLVVWNLRATSSSFTSKQGLPIVNQVLSWLMFGLSFLLALCGSPWMLGRLLNVSLALAVPFLLLSVSHEGLFLLALTVNMFSWLAIEHFCSATLGRQPLSEFTFQARNDTKEERQLTSSDFRRAFFFLLYIILSFFGTGNVASINSFDPAWVRSFLSVFSPFVMTLLILWKTLVPFLTVTCVFRAVNLVVQAPTGQLFVIVLVFCDAMGLHFLHLVTNRGSWLDIGTSISHYVILQSTVLFLVVLYGLAGVLTGVTIGTRGGHLASKHESLEAGGSVQLLLRRAAVRDSIVKAGRKDKRH